jgi:hypothetical protein
MFTVNRIMQDCDWLSRQDLNCVRAKCTFVVDFSLHILGLFLLSKFRNDKSVSCNPAVKMEVNRDEEN